MSSPSAGNALGFSWYHGPLHGPTSSNGQILAIYIDFPDGDSTLPRIGRAVLP